MPYSLPENYGNRRRRIYLSDKKYIPMLPVKNANKDFVILQIVNFN